MRERERGRKEGRKRGGREGGKKAQALACTYAHTKKEKMTTSISFPLLRKIDCLSCRLENV